MISGKEFVKKIKNENSELFDQSRSNVRRFFASNPSKEHMIEHFTGRMVNEAMNMKAIAAEVASAPASMDVTELELLTNQAQDEAKHFRMVKEVIEHITKQPVDVEAAIAREAAKPTAKGASLFAKYGDLDEVVLSTYQLIAEGRAERNWDMMANCIEDDFIAGRYARIARDEGFHATIGARKLEKLCSDPAVQARVETLAAQMRQDLYQVCCDNSMPTAEAKAVFEAAYA
jgi:rubrerythrin